MPRAITTHEVRAALLEKREIALLDLREEGVFAEAHPLFAACLPLGRLELEILDRVPRPDTPIIVYDDGEGLVGKAAGRLAALGYSDVRRLAGGLAGWRAAGGEVFRDVNAPSKAFGELVEATRHTPSLSAPEVKALIDQGADIVILDARRFEEYRTMSIPSGRSVPGGELAFRVRDLAPRPETTIIVNCAGRTRSILGTQSLINAGIPNRVAALRNGTIGWTLAGFTLETGQMRRFGGVSPANAAHARHAAAALADRTGVGKLALADLPGFLTGHGPAAGRTVYRFDIRNPEEYEAGHLPGFRLAPGGQLVQETDVFAPVRGARIVLADHDGVRAAMTGSWLAQMGWEVWRLEADLARTGTAVGPWRPLVPPLPPVDTLPPEALHGLLQGGTAAILDLAPSPHYRKAHIPGAFFARRDDLADALRKLPDAAPIILTSPDGTLARFAAADSDGGGPIPVSVLAGGTAAWQAAGFELETGASRLLSEPIDVYRRPYEGTDNAASAMQAYLDWEFGLVEQLARDGTHGFHIL